MLEKLSNRLADRLLREKLIPADERDIYAYGMELFLLRVAFYSVILLTAIVTDSLFTGVVFSVVYLSLRQYAGGYHCKTPMRCMAVSLGMYLAVVMVCRADMGALRVTAAAADAVSFAVIAILSPSESENNPLTCDEKQIYRRKAVILAAAYLLIGAAAFIFGYDAVFLPLSCSFAAVSVLMLLNIKGGKNYEKDTSENRC